MKLERVLKIYNDSFWNILFIVIAYFVIVGTFLYFKKQTDEDDAWYTFRNVIKRKLAESFVLIFMTMCVITILNNAFSINVLSLINISQSWKIFVGIWLGISIVSGKRFYDKCRFRGNLHEIRYGEYKAYAEIIMLDEINRYEAEYMLQTEMLGILKNLTPVSLIPLVAGYILEGKDIKVDWNWYTIAFVMFLFVYFFALWKCYSNMKFFKLRAVAVQNELRDVQYKKEKESSEKEECKNKKSKNLLVCNTHCNKDISLS